MSWKDEYRRKLTSVDKALDAIKDGDSIFFGITCGVPELLNKRFWERVKEWKNLIAIPALTLQPMPLEDPSLVDHVKVVPFFLGPIERKGLKTGLVSYPPVHFSQVCRWLKEVAKPRVSLIQFTPPDENGYMNLSAMGNAVGKPIMETSEIIIAEVNDKAPYVYGEDTLVHVSEVDFIVEHSAKLPELPNPPVSEKDEKIASYIIDLIPDGATIQVGIGGIANAVAYGLECKKNLGIHTEMLTDAMVYLAKKGVVNCSKKTYLPGKIVSSQYIGSQEQYDFIDRNEMIYGVTYEASNAVANIAKNDNMMGIMGTLAVDLTGQAASEALGFNQFSSTGGQADFVRGCKESKGGKSFITLHSTVERKDGEVESRIVLSHLPGAAITTHRADIHYVVTEYGIADLLGETIEERAKKLINIAHPDFRDELTKDAKKYGLIR